MLLENSFRSEGIKSLGFPYTQQSVVRFFGSNSQLFFVGFDLKEELLTNAINYCIKHSAEGFYVAYHTYKDSPILYITHGVPQTKPYWFNVPKYKNLAAQSKRAYHLPKVIEKRYYNDLGVVAKRFKVTRGDVASLALLVEFSPNGFLHAGGNDLASLPTRINMDFNFPKPMFEHPKIKDAPNKSYAQLESDLVGILYEIIGPNLSSNVEDFANNIKREFDEYKNELRLIEKLDEYKYKLEALDVGGAVIKEDELSVEFIPSKIEQLYYQNLHYYQGAFSIQVYDPFLGFKYIHFPSLPSPVQKKKMQPCNLTIPSQVFYWLSINTGSSNRFRISMLNQAFENTLSKWVVECERLDSEEVSEISNSIVAFSKKSLASTEAIADLAPEQAPKRARKSSPKGEEVVAQAANNASQSKKD